MSQGSSTPMPTRSTGVDRKISTRLIATRTMTVARVLKVYANGWVQLDPQIQMVVQDPRTGVETAKDVAVLDRVPIGFYKAGGFIMTLPVAVGDEGIVVFSDRSLDLWKATGKKNPPKDARFHDLSDGVFMPFPTSTAGAIAGYNAGAAYLGKEDQSGYLKINADNSIVLHSGTKITLDAPLTEITGLLHVLKAVTMDETLDVAKLITALNLIAGTFNAQTHRHTSTTAGTPTSTYIP